jgi:MYXO-CTERM domain-containing protein
MGGMGRLGIVAVGAALAVYLAAPNVDACGACFHEQQQKSPTQVTGHRMVLSLSTTQTTLYDQIEYTGSPQSFAWVLPIQGVVQVGLSSDLMFAQLDAWTSVLVSSPPFSCPGGGGGCVVGSGTGPSSATSGGGGGIGETEGGVEVIAEEVVGPFETVQLSSADPQALQSWLASRGYFVPPDIAPIIDAYVADGFDFLAVKLVPGANVQAMRPLSVTMPGAGPVLPLRMVAGGTGAQTLLTLWIVSEGRYQPQNFPWFVIDSGDLVWDFDTKSSNYKTLRADGFSASGGYGWLVESAEPIALGVFEQDLLNRVILDPAASGYGDGDATSATVEAQQDLTTLAGGVDRASAWVTRLRGELVRAALADDLVLEAADSQFTVPRSMVAFESVGTPYCPPNPPPPNCTSVGGFGDGDEPDVEVDAHDGSGCGCAMPSHSGKTAALLALLALGVTLWRRRS